MFWVVQDNLYREYNHSILMNTLKRMEIPHVEVKVIPFVNRLIPTDFDLNNYMGCIEDVPEVDINTNGSIMVCGAITLAKIAKERGWKPGSFLNDNFHYSKWKEAFGQDLLNYESIIDTFKNIEPKWNEFFIRPCEDTKDFNGGIMTREKFNIWKQDMLNPIRECKFENSEVIISPIKNIYGEYRFFVVDKKVITYSQYKLGSTLYMSSNVDDRIVNFAQNMVDKWQPARAFVIDIAETNDGFKVIEINNFNSAGFYACDVSKIINAIESMEK